MNKEIVIAVDAMGGDKAPSEVIKGVIDAIKCFNVRIILVGDQNIIADQLSHYIFSHEKIEVVHAPEVIGFDEAPAAAVRNKKNSSIVIGLNLLKNKIVSAFISAGSSGALLTGATIYIGRIKGIDRPALATVLPTINGFSFLLDCGANVDAKSHMLLQFAKMGSVYMENVMGVLVPKVGLINIGVEREKGNALVKEAFGLLESSNVNFIGNLEARDIAFGKADVMVCDAFVGNIILKHSEGLSSALFSIIKKEITSTFISKIASAILKPSFKRVKQRFEHSEYGGAPFLGLNSLVIKSHGNSDAKTIKNTIKQSIDFVETNIVGKIEEKIL